MEIPTFKKNAFIHLLSFSSSKNQTQAPFFYRRPDQPEGSENDDLIWKKVVDRPLASVAIKLLLPKLIILGLF